MNLVVYILVYPFIWILSILPFRVLYILSDILYYIIYYVIGYRSKVVKKNLKLAFPDKSDKELIQIKKDFYRHFVDIFLEMIKSFSISSKEINKRYTYKNVELINGLYSDNKSIILMGSHYANWEWVINLGIFMKHKGYGAYKKISNPYFNKMVLKSRERFGIHILPTTQIISEIEFNHKNNIQSLYGLLSDQSPQLRKSFYWREFLGVKAPVHTGAEMLAKKYNMNVVFMDVKKIKRGYYETTFSLITDDVSKMPNHEITDIFVDKVEEQIYRDPKYYFWTHNRFKHCDKLPKE